MESKGLSSVPGASHLKRWRGWVLAAWLASACLPAALQADETERVRRATQLVEQLGSQQFAARERASAALVELGAGALEALQKGQASANREVRERSQRILALIHEINFQQRLRQFEADADPERDYGLPGWPSFRERVGEDTIARSLFVSMQEEEQPLLAALAADAATLNRTLSQRCDELRDLTQFGGVPTRLGSMAALLFAAGHDQVELTPAVRGLLYSFCRETTFESAVKSGPKRPPLARLVERWIERDGGQPAAFVLDIGLRCDLPACLPRAKAILKQPGAPQSDRLYACLCLAKFGSRDDFELLESQLADPTICAQAQVDQLVVATQLRDVALAALVLLAGRDPAEFGFDRLQRDRDVVFHVASLGFRDVGRREQAIAAWHEYRRQQATP